MITYVFSNGRQSRVQNKSVEAKDFFMDTLILLIKEIKFN